MKRFNKYLAILALVLLPAMLFAQQIPGVVVQKTPEKYALVIGNGAYTNLSRLANPANDAEDVTATLQKLGFTVDKILNGSLEQMESAVTRLKNRLSVSEDAYGFFFYAGHGVQSGGENYLIPVDANIPSENYLRNRTVTVQTVLDELNDARNSLNVVVLDACRDNPFGWGRSSLRGLATINRQPADSIIVYATSAGQQASDGQGRNGLFTSQLLPHLSNPDLEVGEVFKRTGAAVAVASSGLQRPAVYNQFFGSAYLGTYPTVVVSAQPAVVASVQQPEPAAQPVPQPLPEIEARAPREPKPPRDLRDFSLDGKKVFSLSVYPKIDVAHITNQGFGAGLTLNFYEQYKNYGRFFIIPNSFFFSAETYFYHNEFSGSDDWGTNWDGQYSRSGAILGLGALYKIRLEQQQRFIANFGLSFQLFLLKHEKNAEGTYLKDNGRPETITPYSYSTSESKTIPGIGLHTGISFRFNQLVSLDFGFNVKGFIINGDDGNMKWFHIQGDPGIDINMETGTDALLNASLGVTFWWPR